MNSLRAVHLLLLLTVTLTGCATGPEKPALEVERWAMEATPLNRTAARLNIDTAENLAWAKTYYDQVIGVDGERTVENTLVPFNYMNMHLEASASECSLLYNVHPDESVRKMAEDGEKKIAKYLTELSLDRKLYEAVKGVDANGADRATKFNIEKTLRDFRRAGVDKSDQVRHRIARLNDEILQLGQEFARNIAADIRHITVDSPSQLAGLPQDWIDKHPPGDDGKIRITTQYPDYGPFMTYARDAALRHALYKKFRNRGYPQNLAVLQNLITKRHELAGLLGYRSWADYVTEDKMIGSAQATHDFLDRIAKAGEDATTRELARLLARKQKDVPGAKKVKVSERAYYENLVRAEDYSFDAQAVRPYFNFPSVQKGIFELTGKLFGIRYEQVRDLDLWHEDVTAWDVYDGDQKLGRFFLDLHPRDNKYSHAAQFDYRAGIKGLRLPQAVLVCNFPDPGDSADGLALMEHDDVVTFFHEFGHLLHAIFAGHRNWLGNTGISTEWDFVEAPSQMLEEWCYTAEPLQIFARHHRTGEPIPVELVANLKRAAEFGKGIQNAHQVFYSAVSLNYYDTDPATLETTKMLAELQARFSPFDHVEGTHLQCAFGHLDGYSAIYYTYRWSLVIAKSMFSKFERNGLLNTRTAAQYRSKILEPGGSKPAAELVRDFLGKDYSFQPFEIWLNRG
ncbi:MAG: M3 family metallopeptidase [Planctomycetota bacterium]|jgi:thimet oligopeptidase